MLAPHLKTPLVPQTSVAPDLEQPLDIFSELGLEDVGGDLQVLALLVVPLPVQEPSGDAVALGISNQAGNGIALSLSQLSGSELGVESEDLADEESEATANSLDLVEGEGDGALSVDVCIEDTVDVLEGVLSVLYDQRHCG